LVKEFATKLVGKRKLTETLDPEVRTSIKRYLSSFTATLANMKDDAMLDGISAEKLKEFLYEFIDDQF